jgi:transcription antitermination protein NusB
VSARGKARKRALDVLYEADVRRTPVLTVLEERVGRADPPVAEYTVSLVEGVAGHQGRIDTLLARYAVGWTLDRMPPVDRNILRLGAYELLWEDDVPDAVVLAEAVALARDLSSDESPSFVNGLLAQLQESKPSLL